MTPAPRKDRRSRFALLRRLTCRPAGAFGLTVLAVLLIFALLPHAWLPHDLMQANPNERFRPPAFLPGGSWSHPLGTEALGGDILSMLIAGTRYTLIIVLGAGVVSLLLGVSAGLLAGYFGRWVDTLLMRFTDMQLAFPALVLIIAVVAAFGPSVLNLILILGFVGWAPYARLVRGTVLSLRERGFIQSAVATGIGTPRILFRHLLPNAMTSILVYFTAELSNLVLLEAALSYLGLGVQPPNPSWGSMIASAQQYLADAWWASVFPGIFIIVTVLAINFLGDDLRDDLDPTITYVKQRRRKKKVQQ